VVSAGVCGTDAGSGSGAVAGEAKGAATGSVSGATTGAESLTAARVGAGAANGGAGLAGGGLKAASDTAKASVFALTPAHPARQHTDNASAQRSIMTFSPTQDCPGEREVKGHDAFGMLAFREKSCGAR
jgi:hypothetical protein